MTMQSEDMSQVAASDELVSEGVKQFRISKVNVDEGQGTGGANRINYVLTIQTEGPDFGRTIFFNCDMGDARGRGNLKTLYKACGYNPGSEGHDPERIVDGEFYGTVKHNHGKDGNTYANIMPWSIKALTA